MRTLLFGICILIGSSVFAQRACNSSTYVAQQKSIDPNFAARINSIENFIQRQGSVATRENTETVTVIRIPVVVHVLYKTTAQNISDEQIKSQIDALNRDFRRKNGDSVNTPARFKDVAADIPVEFYLATADPKGRATDGIVRKATNVTYWAMDDKIKFSAQGGDDAWDTRYYLNFWVGSMVGVLGYSSTPGGPTEKDGIVVNTMAFGTINVNAPYHMGRTVVHETGHWLGLKHIWGDQYCGDDLVNDTPKQGNFTAGCPSSFRSSCTNGTQGDMYMNYMDFTDDACMNMFTRGQKERMLALFKDGGPRNAMLSSKGLNKPWTVDAPVVEIPTVNTQFKCYPNPARSEVVLNFEFNNEWMGMTVYLVNMNGVVLSEILVSDKTKKISIAGLKPGVYFIQGDNGHLKIREKLIKL
jgi:hypothetical protein